MNKELTEAVKLFVRQPLNNPLSRGQIMEVARIALPILEQHERGEGEWVEWGRFGQVEVPDGAKFDIKFRDGTDDIIAYRIIPEQATNQNGEAP